LRGLGELAEAMDCAEDAVEAAMLSGGAELGAMAQGMRCWIAVLSGDTELAVRAGSAAVTTAGEDIGWWATIAKLLHAIAKLASNPSADVSGEVLAAGGGPLLSRVDPFSKALWYAFLAQADLAQGRGSQARQWVELAERFSSALPVQQGVVLLTAARVAALDDPALALSLAEDATKAFAEGGARLEIAESRLFAGTMSAQLGHREQALTELSAAADEFAACGARRMHAQAAAALRKLGKRVPSFKAARQRGQAGLTSRERDVARLVAAGRTNKQIARELVISLKTVETHVGHILAKLGVPNRSAAVAVLRDQD
jgi:DNA-binding CsgD family transcriptional regulator